MREGDERAAIRHFKRTLAATRDADAAAFEMNTLASLAQAQLALGDTRAALASTRRATKIHRAHGLAPLQALSSPMIWWRYSQALQANGEVAAAREALDMAYQFMLNGIAGLSDEGLRRNYLNKIEEHREIVGAWIKKRASGACPGNAAPPIWRAKRVCANLSSGWWTPVCA